jgi:hypothetical protein
MVARMLASGMTPAAILGEVPTVSPAYLLQSLAAS